MKTILLLILSFIYIGNIKSQETFVVKQVTDIVDGTIYNTENPDASLPIKTYLAKTTNIETGDEGLILMAYSEYDQDWTEIEIDRILETDGTLMFIKENRRDKLLLLVYIDAINFKSGYGYIYNFLIQKKGWKKL